MKNKYLFFYIVTACIFVSLLNFSPRDMELARSNLFSYDRMIRVFCISIAFILMVYTMVIRKNHYFKIPKSIVALVSYVAIAPFSLVSFQLLEYSVSKYFEYVTFILYIYFVARYDNDHSVIYKAYRLLINYLKVLILSVAIGLLINPSSALYAGMNEYSALRDALFPFILTGWLVVIPSTSVGFISAIVAYILLVEAMLRGFSFCLVVQILVCLVFVCFAQSRVAVIALICAILFFLLTKDKVKGAYKLIVILILIFISILTSDFVIEYLRRGQNTGMLYTLSGRTVWWSFALKYYESLSYFEKFFGAGFAGAEKVIVYKSNALMYSLDSDYLSSLLCVGICGLVCIIMSLFFSVKNIRVFVFDRLANGEDYVVGFQTCGILLMLLIRTFTVTSLSVATLYLLIYIISNLLLYFIVAKQESRCDVSMHL